MKYLSVIIIFSLISSLLITELYNNNTRHILSHAIQGSLIFIFFLLFANYGLEIINWIVLCSLPIFFIITLFFVPSKNDNPISSDEKYNKCNNLVYKTSDVDYKKKEEEKCEPCPDEC